jgi:hypothetical protein
LFAGKGIQALRPLFLHGHEAQRLDCKAPLKSDAKRANETAKQTPYYNSPTWLETHALVKARQRDAACRSEIIAWTVRARRHSLYSTQVRVHHRKR